MTNKAIREREVRIKRRKERRFDIPLRCFIQHKYGTIFQEYQDLYNRMDTNHPTKIDLTKSKTYKEWLASTESAETASVAEQIQETGQDLPAETASVAEQIQETGQDLPPETASVAEQIQETGQDLPAETASVAEQIQETGQDLPAETASVAEQIQETGQDLADRIDSIVNELLQDDLLRDIINPDNDVEYDEGIELNIMDEIHGDIQPFDFDQEVWQDFQ